MKTKYSEVKIHFWWAELKNKKGITVFWTSGDTKKEVDKKIREYRKNQKNSEQ